jgi:hypothetical protein
MLGWVQDYLLDPSWLERVGDQFRWRIIPQDKIDPLPYELVTYPADSTTALADTNADGINTGHTALQCQLDTSPALAGNRFDLDHTCSNLGDLLSKEACNFFNVIAWPGMCSSNNRKQSRRTSS